MKRGLATGGSGSAGDGSAWFTAAATNSIGRIDSSGTESAFALPPPNRDAFDITTGADGNLWFTETSASRIGRLTPDGEFEYALVDFGGTRLFLTPKTVFEHRLPTPLPEGLTHAVFEVSDLDKELARLVELGTEILIPPVDISAGLGSRRLAFCRSPGGLVFEVMQIHESLV